jgi:hypothetical protein
MRRETYSPSDLKQMLLEHLTQLIACEALSESAAHKIAQSFDHRHITFDPFNQKIALLH